MHGKYNRPTQHPGLDCTQHESQNGSRRRQSSSSAEPLSSSAGIRSSMIIFCSHDDGHDYHHNTRMLGSPLAKCSETLVQDPLYKNLSPCASPDSQKHGLPRPSNFGVACLDRFVMVFTFGWFRCCLVAAVLVVSAGDNLRLLSARLLAPTLYTLQAQFFGDGGWS